MHLWSPHGEPAGGSWSVGRYAGRWCYIPGSTRNLENEGTTDYLSCMLCSVYAVLGVCWTRCMLYSEYAVLGVFCTRSMLYSGYAVLGVCSTRCVCSTWCILHSVYAAFSGNSWWWYGEMEWDDLTWCSCNDGRVVAEKERDGRWWWARYGGYKRLSEITWINCLIGFRRLHISVITRRIRTPTCGIRDGQSTRTWNSLKSQFFIMISPISSDLGVCCAQLNHHLSTRS